MIFKKKQSWFASLSLIDKVVLLLAIAVITIITGFLIHSLGAASKKNIYLCFVPVLLGLVLELWRSTRNWKTVGIVTLVAYLPSLLAFAERKRAANNLQNQINAWMVIFIGLFAVAALFAVSFEKQRHTITEGFVLLLTLAINYWIIANGYWLTAGVLVKLGIAINWIASAFACYHAFTYHPLDKGHRLLLSIWVCLISLVLALDNGYYLYLQSQVDAAIFSEMGWLLFVQYFLLGISAIYIIQNIALTAAYLLPGSHIPLAGDAHLKRLSDKQVHKGYSLIVLLVSVVLFTGNYFFNWLPVNTIIWVNIVLLPLILSIIQHV